MRALSAAECYENTELCEGIGKCSVELSFPTGFLVTNLTFLYRIAKKAFSTLGCKDSEFFEGMGEYFVELATSIG